MKRSLERAGLVVGVGMLGLLTQVHDQEAESATELGVVVSTVHDSGVMF